MHAEEAETEPHALTSERFFGLIPWMILAMALAVFTLLRCFSGWEIDELEHLHFAWNIGQGRVPYRDFFEHHPPLLHYLIAPIFARQRALSLAVLVECRLVALVLLAAFLSGFYRLLCGVLPRRVAAWGLPISLLFCPVPGKLFDLRPDWLGLALLTWGIVWLHRAFWRAETCRAREGIWPGVLFALSAWTTQKAFVLLLAVFLWAAIVTATLFRERRGAENVLAGCLAAFGGGVLLAWAFFALQGAGQATLEHIVFINLRWPREIAAGWQGWWGETLPVAFGLLVIAVAQAALCLRHARKMARQPDSSLRLLLAIFLVVGFVAYVRTPVPYEQSLIFYVTLWSGALATVGIVEIVSAPTLLRQRGLLYAAAAVCCGLTLPAAQCLFVAVFWLSALLAAAVVLSRLPRQGPRQQAALLLASLICVTGCVRAGRHYFYPRDKWKNQLAYAGELARLHEQHPYFLAPDVIPMPFVFYPSYFWFAPPGVVGQADREYARAIEAGEVNAVVGLDELKLKQDYPLLCRSLAERSRRVPPGETILLSARPPH